MPTQAPAKPGQQQAPAAPPQPFVVGNYDQEFTEYDETKTMTASTVKFPSWSVLPNGWLRGLWFLIECTTSGNAATVALKADGPFSVIDSITFKDVGGREVFGPIDGYDWLNVMKWGGYHEVGDPRSDITYSATVGAGATGGSFTLVMYLPLEIVHRDGLGSLENKSTSSSYKVEIVMAASTDVYSTAPTTLGSVRIRITEDGYSEPEAADAHGRPYAQAPPAAGAMQYWGSEDDTLSAGTATYLIQQGLGYSIRNIVFKLVDSNGSRAQGDADWPGSVTMKLGQVQLFERYQKIWQSRMGKTYGLTSTSTDVSLGRENGVYPVWFTRDFGFKPGAELRNGYLITKPGNVLQWAGSIGGAGTHTLYTLVNYIVPPGQDPAALRAMR